MGTQSNFQMRVLSVLSLAVVASSAPHGWQQVGKTGASNCDYVSDKVTYYDTDSIGPDGPVYVGNTSLPSRLQGVFWLVNDGGDALVSFGAPPGGDPQAECNNGRLVQDGSAYCATVSTVRPGGWTFQAFGTPYPGVSGGSFPTSADSFYRTCGEKWKFCFDDETQPTSFDAKALSSRYWCLNVFAAASTTGVYNGTKYGGEYWRVTTKALGVVPLPSWMPGNFDMIQVMDAQGTRIQPAWSKFASDNKKGIVVYDGK